MSCFLGHGVWKHASDCTFHYDQRTRYIDAQLVMRVVRGDYRFHDEDLWYSDSGLRSRGSLATSGHLEVEVAVCRVVHCPAQRSFSLLCPRQQVQTGETNMKSLLSCEEFFSLQYISIHSSLGILLSQSDYCHHCHSESHSLPFSSLPLHQYGGKSFRNGTMI